MKFLFDENISYRIVKKLNLSLPHCIHVSQTSLRHASTDRKIWEYAKTNDYVIVTFDEDFRDLSDLYSFPPKVILLKSGNSSTGSVVALLQSKLEEITNFYRSEIKGIFEVF